MKQIRFGGFVVGVALLSAFTAAQAKHNNITKVVDDGTVIENVTLISPERTARLQQSDPEVRKRFLSLDGCSISTRTRNRAGHGGNG